MGCDAGQTNWSLPANGGSASSTTGSGSPNGAAADTIDDNEATPYGCGNGCTGPCNVSWDYTVTVTFAGTMRVDKFEVVHEYGGAFGPGAGNTINYYFDYNGPGGWVNVETQELAMVSGSSGTVTYTYSTPVRATQLRVRANGTAWAVQAGSATNSHHQTYEIRGCGARRMFALIL